MARAEETKLRPTELDEHFEKLNTISSRLCSTNPN